MSRRPDGPLSQWHLEYTSDVAVRHGRYFNAFVLHGAFAQTPNMRHGAVFQRFRQGWCFDSDSVIIGGRIQLRRLGTGQKLFELPARPQENQGT